MRPLPHIPALRLGRVYESLDKIEVKDCRSGDVIAVVSSVNAGIIRKDLQKIAASRDALKRFTVAQLIDLCRRAGDLFLNGILPLGIHGETQSPQQYIEMLSCTSGLPHVMVRRNMSKIQAMLGNMRDVLAGLTRELDFASIDRGAGRYAFRAMTQCLGVVMPSNSPGVNSLWLPAIALKIPVVLKPGREEPWTPYRIIQALIAAGVPAAAFGFYPTDHEGAEQILQRAGRALIFGDKSTIDRYAGNPAIQVHGPGFSKILIGADQIDRWNDFLDVMVSSIADNGGRSCINASSVVVPRQAGDIADALAQRLGPIGPLPATADNAVLAGFANPTMAASINAAIEEGLKIPGATDVTAAYRNGPRLVQHDGGTYLRPTIVRCDSFDHPLANREFLFPYASVVEMPEANMVTRIGPSLVVTAITNDEKFVEQLIESTQIDRLNIGPISTMKISWDQPHEGNLFEFLYRRRAYERG